jgi:plasmid stabilization system protein ParE
VNYWIHPEAETELGDAAEHYATEANLAIAEAFLAEYERVLDLLIENQQFGMRGDHGMRL